MELEFNSSNLPITPQEILQRVSEYDIFRYYCKNFKELDKSFCSELRDDKHPGCRIFLTFNNQIKYRDFANGITLDCWQYVMAKFGCLYWECLNIISNDFSIKKSIITLEPRVIAANDEFKLKITNIPREKSRLEYIPRSWKIEDYDYFSSFGISFELLDLAEVIPCKYVYLIKEGKRFTYSNSKKNPIYLYKEYDINLEFVGYRVYFPLAEKGNKWLNSSSTKAIQGVKLLPQESDLLILSKSLKDILVLNTLGFFAISLASENINLNEDLFNKLKIRFKNIILFYDNDDTGMKFASIISERYYLKCIYLDKKTNCKDISEYRKINTFLDTKKIILKLLNE